MHLNLSLPTRAQVADRLAYDLEAGVFTWLACSDCLPQWNTRFAGQRTGSVDSVTGYVRIRLNNRLYYAHRLAWLLVYGEWPSVHIDHRNGIRTDNRIVNLRLATRAENAQNLGLRRDNACGMTGVWRDRRTGRWHAELRVRGKRHRRGGFSTPHEARAVYLALKKEAHTFQPVPREVCS